MTEHPDDDQLDRLQDRIDAERDELARLEGTDDRPRFSDDGMVERGAGSDSNAPPG